MKKLCCLFVLVILVITIIRSQPMAGGKGHNNDETSRYFYHVLDEDDAGRFDYYNCRGSDYCRRYVWVSDDSKYYHCNRYCSKMSFPYKVTVAQAWALGKYRCPVCCKGW